MFPSTFWLTRLEQISLVHFRRFPCDMLSPKYEVDKGCKCHVHNLCLAASIGR